MVASRIALLLALLVLISWPVGSAVLAGLRTGRLPHTDSRSVIVRRTRPVRFWALMTLFLTMLGLFGYVAISSVQRILA